MIVCDWCGIEQDALGGAELMVTNPPERDKGREYAAVCTPCLSKLLEGAKEEQAKRQTDGGGE